MMKLIALVVVAAALAVASVYTTYPGEFRQATENAAGASLRVWSGIEANPVPVLVALGTFLLTIVYHKLKGKSFSESVEVAATRVTVVAVPAAPAAPVVLPEPENTVVRRAQARATRTQLLTDQIGLENRLRKLPAEVQKAEHDVCYADQAMTVAEEVLTKAEQTMEAKIEAHTAAVAKLEALRKELAAGDAELTAIATELKKLADVV
jgi:hypothetical protein